MITFTIPAFILIVFVAFLLGVVLTSWVLMFKLSA